MTNVIKLSSRRGAVCWPPPPEYVEAREHLSASVAGDVDALPDYHWRAIARARREYPGRAEELRRLFRILDVGRRLDAHYRQRWSA